MYLFHAESDASFKLCPRLLWEVGPHGDINAGARPVSRPRYFWRRVNALVWMTNDRWFAGRDVRGYWDYEERWEYTAVRVNDAVLEREIELVHGDILDVDGVVYRVVGDADDPPRAALPAMSWPRAHMRPVNAMDAFARGEIEWIDSLVVLASHTRFWPMLRKLFRTSAEYPESAVRGAALRGLMALAASGGVEAAEARRAIATVAPDAELVLRMGAARALAGFDPLAAAPKLLAVIREALEEGEMPKAAAECASVLARTGESSAIDAAMHAATVAAADAPARKRRALAARVLGELSAANPAALRPLRALASDPHESVRLSVARAASAARAVDVLVEAAVDDDERVRGVALAALRALPEAGERLLVAADAAADGTVRQGRLMDMLDRLTVAPA